MKFSGYSWDSGTKIYGTRFNLIIRQTKTKEIEWEIKKKSKLQFTMLPLMLLIVLDGVYFASNYLHEQITAALEPIIQTTSSGIDQSGVFSFLSSPPFIQLQSFLYTNEDLISNVLGLVVLVGLLYVFHDFFKHVKPWHGLEHKLIEAAKVNDVQHASSFDPISNRCGATYMISGWVAMGLLSLVEYGLGFPAPVGIFSMFVVMILAESRWWHNKNTIGIRFGRINCLVCFISCSPCARSDKKHMIQ